jgi:hypothetical protein
MEQYMKHDFVIIDPSSPEFNRGSFCYLTFILFSALKSRGFNVVLLEDFSCADIDSVPEAETYLVGLWSYPQIDSCLVLNRFLPKRPSFFGYYPLIEIFRFQKYRISDQEIQEGIMSYVEYFEFFERILLSDCDMHLTKYEGTVYPLFTSYGCVNKCKFCPVSVNCDSKRIVVPLVDVKRVLNYCEFCNYKNIHFTDEDFFFDADRAAEILRYTQGKGFNYIALGSVHTVTKFIEKFGIDIFDETGMRLIEVGLESADSDLNKAMGKGGADRYSTLAELVKGKVDIFWLTMTFFPGETIQTLRSTGLFLEKYGFKLEDLYGRIQTNSTVGGLGQFFQSYVGTIEDQDIDTKGICLSARPVRLLPSFIPYSFLNCKINQCRPISDNEKKWYRLYRIDEKIFNEAMEEVSLAEDIYDLFEILTCDFSVNDVVAFLAISARLGVIS